MLDLPGLWGEIGLLNAGVTTPRLRRLPAGLRACRAAREVPLMVRIPAAAGLPWLRCTGAGPSTR
jgi:hypothetical protein